MIDDNIPYGKVRPHDWTPTGLPLRRVCLHCFAPKELHPRTTAVHSRPIGNRDQVPANDSHFQRGW